MLDIEKKVKPIPQTSSPHEDDRYDYGKDETDEEENGDDEDEGDCYDCNC